MPIPSTKDNKHITNTDILLEQTLVNVSVGSKIVGYELPEEYKEAFLQKILQDIEEDYTKNKTQRCRRWFVYGRKKEGTATL